MTSLMISGMMAPAAFSRMERVTGIEPALSAWELDGTRPVPLLTRRVIEP